MLNKTKISIIIAGLGFFIAINSNAVLAQKTIETLSTSQFQKIEQPIGLKLIVTIGGLSLISAELWWFIFKQN